MNDRELVEFVAHGAKVITTKEVAETLAAMPEIERELAGIDGKEYPHVAGHFRFLVQVIGDFVNGKFDALPYVAAAEVAFALQYLHKEVDVIPDFVPHTGLLDDAMVAEIVLRRNAAVLKKHHAAGKIGWETIEI